mgnify:CR=1 FL=1
MAAANLMGGQETVGRTPWFWSDQYDHQLQIAGDPARGPSVVSRTLTDGAGIDFHLDADARLVGITPAMREGSGHA